MSKILKFVFRANPASDAHILQRIASALVRGGLRPAVEPGLITVPVHGRACRLRIEPEPTRMPTSTSALEDTEPELPAVVLPAEREDPDPELTWWLSNF